MSDNRSINLTDAYNLISKKILINKISIDCFKSQIDFSHSSAKLQLLNVSIIRKKLKLVKQLNEILEQQLSNFDLDRQAECLNLYIKINELDSPTEEFSLLYKKLQDLESSINIMSRNIQELESHIPSEKKITNYKIKPKENNMNTNCSMEYNLS